MYRIIYFFLYNIHIVLVNVKRFRAHCGFYAIENKLLLLLLIIEGVTRRENTNTSCHKRMQV